MTSIHQLAEQVKDLQAQLSVCIRCGMCQSVCPLFEQTRQETDVARGKLALLSGLISELFSDPQGVSERLNRCLLCGSCAANCPSSVNIIDIFIRARAILAEYQGLPLAKQVLLKKMLAKPKVFNALSKVASGFQDLALKTNKNEQGTSCARFVSPLIQHRHILPLAKTPFHKKLKQAKTESEGTGLRILFFTGCLIDKILPRIAHAAVHVLRFHNARVIIPENQGCCGIPALASGDRSTFNLLAEHHLNLFHTHQFDYLVTACATCTSTIKKLWPAFYTQDSADPETLKQFKDMAARTMDINQLLSDILGLNEAITHPQQDSDTVTYHDPCHLKKSLGVSEQPRKVIRAAGYRLLEMQNADKCCGMGGTFNLFHYGLSGRIGNLKSRTISETGCQIVASGCPACIMQISDMLAQTGSHIRVKHPVELYAKVLKR